MYKIVDLFAGAGGLSLGFEMTEKFDIVAFVENNKNAAKTYLANHPGIKKYNDIKKVDFSEIINDEKKIDVVIGGPPCQGFSNANRQKRKIINGNNELIKRYVDAINELRPSVFVMENVKTIASDKHYFYLTEEDQNHIINDLHLNIHEKTLVIYESGNNINELYDQIIKHNFDDFMILDEESTNILRNVVKKKEKLEKYYQKSINVKSTEKILAKLEYTEGMPEWYCNTVKNAKKSLAEILKSKRISEDNERNVMTFWDMQKLFQGIEELNQQKVLFSIAICRGQIIVKMQTYIVIDYVKASFKFLGYETNGKVLSAASFGVPQCRERYILIGGKKEILGNNQIEMPHALIEDEADYVTVKMAISDLEKYEPTVGRMDNKISKNYKPVINSYFRELVIKKDNNTILNHVCTDSREVAKERFQAIGQGENFHSLPKEMKSTYEEPGRTQNTIYKRLVYDAPSDTVVNVRKSMWIHPVNNRAVSAREAARLQSFPDDYEFFGTKDSVYQQIGNAVPPLLGRAVAEVVLKLLDCKEEYVTLKNIYDKYK